MLMFWGEYRTQQPPAFAALQSVSRRSGVISRRELAGRWAEVGGPAVAPYELLHGFGLLASRRHY